MLERTKKRKECVKKKHKTINICILLSEFMVVQDLMNFTLEHFNPTTKHGSFPSGILRFSGIIVLKNRKNIDLFIVK